MSIRQEKFQIIKPKEGEIMPKRKTKYGEHEELPEDACFAASVTECTGLMPTPPKNKDEEESYRGIFSTEVPLYAPSPEQVKEGIYDTKPPEIRS